MIAALIIAAGKTPYKDSFEPLKEVGTIPVIERLARVFQLAGIERIVVVYDGAAIKTENLAAHMNMEYLPGPPEAEMLDNVKVGLAYLEDKCSAVIITHVGAALFQVDTVSALMSTEGQVCIPLIGGRAGHPLRLSSSHFKEIISYSGEGGLSEAVKACGLRRIFVEVSDEGILVDVCNGKEYGHLLSGHSLKETHLDIKISLAREKPFYGSGAHQLLRLIVETGSLLAACRKMGISYTKGRSIISDMEIQLECPVIKSRHGGKRNEGFSVLTEKGEELMKKYADFCSKAKKNLHELFQETFNQ